MNGLAILQGLAAHQVAFNQVEPAIELNGKPGGRAVLPADFPADIHIPFEITAARMLILGTPDNSQGFFHLFVDKGCEYLKACGGKYPVDIQPAAAFRKLIPLTEIQFLRGFPQINYRPCSLPTEFTIDDCLIVDEGGVGGAWAQCAWTIFYAAL